MIERGHVAAALLGGVVLATACGLDLVVDVAAADTPLDAGLPDAAALGPPDADEEIDASPDSRAPLPDAGVPSCDGDGDGFLAANDRCKGNDCDDTSALVHPDAGFVDKVPPLGDATPGDWNCDGKVEYAFKLDASPDCPTRGPLDGTCELKEGWLGTPPCGSQGMLVRCVQLFGACRRADDDLTDRRVECR